MMIKLLLLIWFASDATPGISSYWRFWFVLLIVVLCIITFLYKKGRQKQRVSAINDRVKQIWNFYILQFSLEKRRAIYQKIYCDGSLLYYFQRMYGYSHYINLHKENNEKIKTTFDNRVANNIYNLVLAHTKPVGDSFEVSRFSTPILSKEAYFASFNIDLNNLSYSKELLNQLDIKLNDLKVTYVQKDKQFDFYEDLWEALLPCLKKIVNLHKSGFESYVSDGSIGKMVTQLTDDVITILYSKGISLQFMSESKIPNAEDFFLIADGGFELPLVVRKSDCYVYFKGKILK